MAGDSVASLLATSAGQFASGAFGAKAAKSQASAAKEQSAAQVRIAQAQERAAKARAAADARIAAAAAVRPSRAPWYIAGGAVLAAVAIFGIIYAVTRAKRKQHP